MNFRIWSKKYGMFTSNPRYPSNQVVHQVFTLIPSGEVWCLITTDFENYFRDISNKSDQYIIQRATGLKDKNGIDIYEGDILNSTLAGIGNKFINAVFFEKGCFVFGKGGFSLSGYITDTSGFEIIGNILENAKKC